MILECTCKNGLYQKVGQQGGFRQCVHEIVTASFDLFIYTFNIEDLKCPSPTLNNIIRIKKINKIRSYKLKLKNLYNFLMDCCLQKYNLQSSAQIAQVW